jgi:hypothetical protein
MTSLFQDVTVKWVDFRKHMIVRDGNGTLLYSTLTGYQHPNLTAKDAADFQHHYNQNKKNLDWGS